MLTVFRPHLQEGREYAQWLKDKNAYSSGIIRSEQLSPRPRGRRKPRTSETQKVNPRDFSISVTNAADAKELVNTLSDAGFSAKIYESPFRSDNELSKPEQHESIWIGYAVPAKVAVESIKIAISQWPNLKYMHLSNDGVSPPDYVHHQMYFGGASATAKEYELSPWSNNELLSLNENMSQEEFHRTIRSKYR
jgi:hypothetical protein